MAVPGLVDHLGRPIDLGRLKEVHSAPSIGGVRRVVSGHPAQGLTPQRLASILMEAENASPIRYLELAEEMEEKDLHYLGVLGTRKRAVAQLEITVDAGSDSRADQKAADMVREWLKRDELESDLFDVLDAVGKGFSRTEIEWEMSSREWTPARLEWRDPRWFTFDPTDGRTPLLAGEFTGGNPYGDPLPPFKYICHDHKAKSGLPIRGGLARAAAWGYLFKNYALKDWVAFAEIFGIPVRVGKYGPGETEENIRRLMQAVTDIGADAAAVIPQSMMMEFIGGAGTGQIDLFERLCDYLDRQVSKATLGQTATTDADTGGLGSGKEHGDVRKDIMLADAKQVAATLNRDLIAPFARLNIPGLDRVPRLRIGEAESWDATTMMPAVESYVRMGGRVGLSFVRDRLGIEDPAPDEELLTIAAPVAAAPMLALPAPGNPAEVPDPTAPNKSPGKPGQPVAAPIVPEGEQKAPAALLGPLSGGSGGEAAPPLSGEDAIDRLADDSAGDWRPLMSGVVDPVEALFAGAVSLEDVRARLTSVLAEADSEPLRTRLARAAFAARLAGITGISITEEEPA